MGFNSLDSQALQRAKGSHFPVAVVDLPDLNTQVMRIEVANAIGFDKPAETLSDAIQAAERFFNHGPSTTVWIDVLSSNLPKFVGEAIDRCNSFGVAVVVTHQGSSTHLPGTLLPRGLRQSVANAKNGGRIWHPITREVVSIDVGLFQ